MYDQRRCDVLPENDITFVELSYSEFEHNRRKRLRRLPSKNEDVVRARLATWTMKRRTIYSEAEIGHHAPRHDRAEGTGADSQFDYPRVAAHANADRLTNLLRRHPIGGV